MTKMTICFPDNDSFEDILRELGLKGKGTYLKFEVSDLNGNSPADVAMWVDILGGISREPDTLLLEGLKPLLPHPPEAVRRGVVDLYGLRASLDLIRVQTEAAIKHLELLENLRWRHSQLEKRIAEETPKEVNNE